MKTKLSTPAKVLLVAALIVAAYIIGQGLHAAGINTNVLHADGTTAAAPVLVSGS